jgi:CDP-glucose 4,6-dehydratase
VLEPLRGYLTLATQLSQNPELHGEPFNFGPPAHQNHTVIELVQSMSDHWEQVCWEDVSASGEQSYESGLLKLNCDKALHYLHWHAILSFPETVRMTAEWYRSYYENPSIIREVTLAQIREYETLFSS